MENNSIGRSSKTIIGMVHCLPLPGTPNFNNDCEKIISRAVLDAQTLENAGVNAIIVENMGDTPFSAKLDIEQLTALASVTAIVKRAVKIPVGVDAAFNDCKASLAIALINNCDFVRIPVFVDMVTFSDGIITPCARECMIFKKSLGSKAEKIKILADVQVKHTTLIFPQISIEQSAKTAEECGADAIIVTGSQIGIETPLEMIKRVKKVTKIPIIAGSGVNAKNIREQFEYADGAIIGSSLKEKGIITNPISFELVKEVINGLNI